MATDRMLTWEQLSFGGPNVRFHSQTVGNVTFLWECELDEDCDACHEFDHITYQQWLAERKKENK